MFSLKKISSGINVERVVNHDEAGIDEQYPKFCFDSFMKSLFYHMVNFTFS